MPTIVLRVYSVQDESIVNDNWTEVLFSLTIIESLSVLSDFVEQSLPFVNVIPQLIVNLFRVDDPQGFIIEPYLYVFLGILEHRENFLISYLQSV
jgi:hypothetical protein